MMFFAKMRKNTFVSLRKQRCFGKLFFFVLFIEKLLLGL